MKRLFLIIILFISVAAFSQTQTTTIKLATGDCRTNEAYAWRGADTITFYKLPEDTMMLKVVSKEYKKSSVKFKNIPISEYRFTYKNNFKQLVVKQIKLTNQKVNFINLCLDTLLDYPQNTLAKLQEKDTILINFHSQGCFHTTILKILVKKEVNNYVATLFDVKPYYIKTNGKLTVQNTGDSLIRTVVLTSKNILDFIRFENELYYANDIGCTTTDWYDIRSKYFNIKRADGSCAWNGFYYLRNSFFGDKN